MPLKFDPATTSLTASLTYLLEPSKKITGKKRLNAIGHSGKATGIEVRMLPPLIKDNRTERLFPFPGFAKLYCLTVIVSDLPNQTIGGIDLDKFPRIGDNEYLPINKTLFYWQSENKDEKGPNQIHFISRIIKSKKALRDTGKILTEVKGNEDYKSIVKNLGSLLKKAGSLNPIAEGLVALTSIVGKLLGDVEDKDLGTVIQSYTTLHGDFDILGVNKHVYDTRNVTFNFELIARDAGDAAEKTSSSKSITASAKKGINKTAGKRTKNIEEAEDPIVNITPL